MTEEIIVDGVNVKDCERRIGKNNFCRYFKRNCADNNYNCIWKKCLRLEQQNKELKEKYTHVLELAKTNADSNEYCLQELEKENKELKSRVNEQWKFLEQCGINSGSELRRAGYIINDFVRLSNKYRSALEEIREIAKFNLFYNPDCFSINGDIGQIQNLKMTEIYNRIIEVLND